MKVIKIISGLVRKYVKIWFVSFALLIPHTAHKLYMEIFNNVPWTIPPDFITHIKITTIFSIIFINLIWIADMLQIILYKNYFCKICGEKIKNPGYYNLKESLKILLLNKLLFCPYCCQSFSYFFRGRNRLAKFCEWIFR